MNETQRDDLEAIMEQVKVCIESSHAEQVQLEAIQYNEFIDKLVDMNFKIGVIKQAPLTIQKLADYNIIIIGSPRESTFSQGEIDTLRQFVYNGGGLLLLSDAGGDPMNKNNLSELSRLFGFQFDVNVLVTRSAATEDDEQLVTSTDFYNHFIMRGIDTVALKSACAISIVPAPDAEPNGVVFSPPGTEEVRWNGSEWVEMRGNKHVMVVVSKHGAGKVVGIGTTRILSSMINKKHGIKAADNEKLLVNTLAWLVNREVYDQGKLKSVFVNVSMKPDLYFWIDATLKKSDRFRDFNELVNLAVESLKRGLERLEKP